MATRMAMCPLSFARQHSPLGPPGAQVPVQDHAELASRIAVLDRVLGPHPHIPVQSEFREHLLGALRTESSSFAVRILLRTLHMLLSNGRCEGVTKPLWE